MHRSPQIFIAIGARQADKMLIHAPYILTLRDDDVSEAPPLEPLEASRNGSTLEN
jgi:hypothetical protein